MNNLIKLISLALLAFSINAHDEVKFSQNTTATINKDGDIVTLKGSWVGKDVDNFNYTVLSMGHFNVSEIKCYRKMMMCFESLAHGDGDKQFNIHNYEIYSTLRSYKITKWGRDGIKADSTDNKNRRELELNTSSREVSLTAFHQGSPFLTVIFANPVQRIQKVD